MPYNNADKLKKELFLRTEGYAASVRMIYEDIMERLVDLAIKVEPFYDKDLLFSFSDYPTISRQADELLTELYSRLHATMKHGITSEWENANKITDELIKSVFGESVAGDKRLAHYFNRNKEAMDAFMKRALSSDGLNLSKTIWNLEGQFREDMELSLDLLIGQGKSADVISREIRKFLDDPDTLFDSVKKKRGEEALLQRPRSSNPGPGQYRSSYLNAQRLARTETNMAYRAADYERWQQIDFVVGIEIRNSNNPNMCPLCIELAGLYPKDFKFVGWHPQCRCFVVTILASEREISRLLNKIMAGEDTSDFRSMNEIKGVPEHFKKWIVEKKDEIHKAKKKNTLPYFIKDNLKMLSL